MKLLAVVTAHRFRTTADHLPPSMPWRKHPRHEHLLSPLMPGSHVILHNRDAPCEPVFVPKPLEDPPYAAASSVATCRPKNAVDHRNKWIKLRLRRRLPPHVTRRHQEFHHRCSGSTDQSQTGVPPAHSLRPSIRTAYRTFKYSPCRLPQSVLPKPANRPRKLNRRVVQVDDLIKPRPEQILLAPSPAVPVAASQSHAPTRSDVANHESVLQGFVSQKPKSGKIEHFNPPNQIPASMTCKVLHGRLVQFPRTTESAR
jgi:hypothetical protein